MKLKYLQKLVCWKISGLRMCILTLFVLLLRMARIISQEKMIQ